MTTMTNTALISQFTLRIVRALQGGPMRFNALDRAAQAPNPVRLSKRLKLLVRDGIVERRVIQLGPPAVTEYSLTPFGADLAKPAAALIEWTEAHADEVRSARDYHKSLAAQS